MAGYSPRKKLRKHIDYMKRDIERAIGQYQNVEGILKPEEYPEYADALSAIGQGLALLHDLIENLYHSV